jgi:uncharacterized protein YbjT (DUF2867 family)
MILITGAAGKTGRAVTRALAEVNVEVRALVHRQEYVDLVHGAGAKSAIVGDMGDPSLMERAMNGVQAVYHICPNVSPQEVTFGRIAISKAYQAGVEHFVYHSVLHPQTQKMPHHWLKLRVEEMLLESGLPFTILQPAAYMQNILGQWDSTKDTGIYQVPYPAETRLSMVDLEDVAEAAAIVLSQPGHIGASYQLVGPDILTQLEVAEIIGQHLERRVVVEQVSLEDWEGDARSNGLGEYQIRSLIRMFRYYGSYGFWGNSNVLSTLLVREPTEFTGFVKRIMMEYGDD